MADPKSNTLRLRELFQRASTDVDLRGILGVTPSRGVYDALIDVQKHRMREVVGSLFDGFLE